MEPKWLRWAKQLQAIAQAGLEYSKDKYDIERFQQIRNLSAEIMSEYTEISKENFFLIILHMYKCWGIKNEIYLEKDFKRATFT